MAFVRWRKSCAELLTTRYENGRSRQVLLANLPGMFVPGYLQQEIEARFPGVKVDWAQVDAALARGPKGDPEPPAQHLRLAQVEHMLRHLALQLRERAGHAREAYQLEVAAEVLTGLRQQKPFLEDGLNAPT